MGCVHRVHLNGASLVESRHGGSHETPPFRFPYEKIIVHDLDDDWWYPHDLGNLRIPTVKALKISVANGSKWGYQSINVAISLICNGLITGKGPKLVPQNNSEVG